MSTEKKSPLAKLSTADLKKKIANPKLNPEIIKEAKDIIKQREKKAASQGKGKTVGTSTKTENGVKVKTHTKVLAGGEKPPKVKKEKAEKTPKVDGPHISFTEYRTAIVLEGNAVADRQGNVSVRLGTDGKPYVLLAVIKDDGTRKYRWKQLAGVTFKDGAQQIAAEKIGKKLVKEAKAVSDSAEDIL